MEVSIVPVSFPFPLALAYLVRSLLAITKRTLLDRPLTPGQGNGSSSCRRNFEFNHILRLWKHCQRSFDRTWFVPFCISIRVCFFLPATTLELGLSRSIPTQFDASLRHKMISTTSTIKLRNSIWLKCHVCVNQGCPNWVIQFRIGC